MARARLALAVSLVWLAVGCHHKAPPPGGSGGGGGGAGGPGADADGGMEPAPDMTVPFEAVAPAVYVAKVKNILVGLPPSDAEVQAVVADPKALAGLIDGWMALPEYEQKMLVFFQLAFQQTQVGPGEYGEIVSGGLASGVATDLLIQNLKESFARTVLAFNAAGRPLGDAFTTHQLMMTPALMELYAYLDIRRMDNSGKVTDQFATDNPKLQLTIEASAGPIPIADSINPSSPNYMHWYNPKVGTGKADKGCATDPIVVPADAATLHTLLYGVLERRKLGKMMVCQAMYTSSTQLEASDFSTWKLVTLRAPKAGEAVTRFYDLPTLRAANELVVATPRVGFFTTPAFGANWPTNDSNQMRVTINQTMIVATGKAFDGTDGTMPSSTPGLDDKHAGTPDCVGCHRLLDPTRSILSATYSWFYYPQVDANLMKEKGLFAFDGVVRPVASLDEFAATLAAHPAVPWAWAEKLCYWANSAPCAVGDPEFQRVVDLFAKSNLSWKTLVRELLSSPVVTNAARTATSDQHGEVIGVARRDHLCASLGRRLGLGDLCGLDPAAARADSVVPQIMQGLPSDGYGRGSVAPVLPNQPTVFYRAGLENICAAVAGIVIDGQPNPKLPSLKLWSSKEPDAAIADFVALVMALPPSDARAGGAKALLQAHYADAVKGGEMAPDALRSTFMAACLSPSSIGIGM